MNAVYTIGHSVRPIEEFLAILHSHQVAHLVDVRTVPRSRHNPQFNRETLPATLAAAGIGYTHLAALGGLRKPRPDSPNPTWRNDSFRGYADYMLTDDFEAGLAQLLDIAAAQQTAVMCAEALPWRCHRSLIADALLARGLPAEHIFDLHQRRPHSLTPFARVEHLPGGRVAIYYDLTV